MTTPPRDLPDHLDGPPGSIPVMIQVAASQVGYREGPSNDNAYGLAYGMNHVPWCMQFVWWVARQAGVDETRIPKTASTNAAVAWFRARGQEIGLGAAAQPRAGDLMFVRDSTPETWPEVVHVGVVEQGPHKVGSIDVITTCEGNTSDTGSATGNGVYRLDRALTDRLMFCRPVYVSHTDPPKPPEPPQETTEEDEMLTILKIAEEPDEPENSARWMFSAGKRYWLPSWSGSVQPLMDAGAPTVELSRSALEQIPEVR